MFDLDDNDIERLRQHLLLVAGEDASRSADFDPSLVGEFYELVALLRIAQWDLTDAQQRNRLGTVARFTNVLADYESVTRRSRRDPTNPGEQVGGAVGNEWFYRNFAILLVNYATGSYDDFDGEEDLLGDGVALGTVHGAKGSGVAGRVPAVADRRSVSVKPFGTRQGVAGPTRRCSTAARYEGSDAEERRLFYVALTRARDWVSLSSHSRVTKNAVQAVALHLGGAGLSDERWPPHGCGAARS